MSTGEQVSSAPQPTAPVKFWLKSALVIVAVGIILAWAWMPKATREPEYAGRTLTQWLERAENNWTNIKVTDECADAVRQIGTNGLPLLLQMLAAPEEPWRPEVNALARRIGIDNPLVREPWQKKSLAWQGFAILGPQAQSALPELLAILSRCRTRDERAIIIGSIVEIGPPAEAAIPALVKVGQSGGQDDRRSVCIALGMIARQPEIAMPFLTDQLKDTNNLSRSLAADALVKFTTNDTIATLELIKLLDAPHARVRAAATNALRLIEPAAATKAGIP